MFFLGYRPCVCTDIKQVRGLICDLQQIAKETGHKMPLLIGIDQENGINTQSCNYDGAKCDVQVLSLLSTVLRLQLTLARNCK